MSIGIHIEGSNDILLEGNHIIGFDKGVVVKNSTNVVAADNTVIEKAIQVYGPEFANVIEKVAEEPTSETTRALDDVMSNTDSASESWAVLIKKYGTTIGAFSTKILSKVMSALAYESLKELLRKHGIDI